MSAASRSCLAGLLLGAALASASAQDRSPAVVDPKACSPSERLEQGAVGEKSPATTTGERLSDKLARTDGVLCPPNVDPGIRAPAPQGGAMPVIPPPGSPGGDPSIQPK
jgi:hypothetical protein